MCRGCTDIVEADLEKIYNWCPWALITSWALRMASWRVQMRLQAAITLLQSWGHPTADPVLDVWQKKLQNCSSCLNCLPTVPSLPLPPAPAQPGTSLVTRGSCFPSAMPPEHDLQPIAADLHCCRIPLDVGCGIFQRPVSRSWLLCIIGKVQII